VQRVVEDFSYCVADGWMDGWVVLTTVSFRAIEMLHSYQYLKWTGSIERILSNNVD
jgi:hypothetical protein